MCHLVTGDGRNIRGSKAPWRRTVPSRAEARGRRRRALGGTPSHLECSGEDGKVGDGLDAANRAVAGLGEDGHGGGDSSKPQVSQHLKLSGRLGDETTRRWTARRQWTARRSSASPSLGFVGGGGAARFDLGENAKNFAFSPNRTAQRRSPDKPQRRRSAAPPHRLVAELAVHLRAVSSPSRPSPNCRRAASIFSKSGRRPIRRVQALPDLAVLSPALQVRRRASRRPSPSSSHLGSTWHRAPPRSFAPANVAAISGDQMAHSAA